MLQVPYFRPETTPPATSSQSTKLPRIVNQNERLVSGGSRTDCKRRRGKISKKVSFADLDGNNRTNPRKEPEECPYKWIAEDTLYLRQYGHHLEEDKKDNLFEKMVNDKPEEPTDDLCEGSYVYPCYHHIPGGYRQPSEKHGASNSRSFEPHGYFASLGSSVAFSFYSSSQDNKRSEGIEDHKKQKSFLPPIDPQIISVKKKYGLL